MGKNVVKINEEAIMQMVTESVKNILAERYDEYGLKVPGWFHTQFGTKKAKEYNKARRTAADNALKKSSDDRMNAMSASNNARYAQAEKNIELATDQLVWILQSTNLGKSPKFENEYRTWQKRWYGKIDDAELKDAEKKAWRMVKTGH